MTKTLGLDLGTNSIGWAIVDNKASKILDAGVRIFPEGVSRDKGREISKNEQRRTARQVRRQFFRRSLRKQKLISILIPLGMFPNVQNIKHVLKDTVLCSELRDFFLMNPYELRSKAVSGSRLTLFELGRIFYQLSQRRGYRENLQSEMNEESVLQTGDAEMGKIGIEATKEAMGNKTLGEYLATLNPHEARIRNRYTLRSMYIDEFNRIFTAQQENYPDILTEQLRKTLGEPNKGIIFFQRELRNQKFSRGQCTFENKKTRIAVSNPWFEAFRMYQFVNTVRNAQVALKPEEAEKLIELLLKGKDKIKFSEFKKAIKSQDQSWNYEDDHTIPTCKTIGAILKAFDKKTVIQVLKQRNEKEVLSTLHWLNEIWHVKQMARDAAWFMDYALNKWHLEDKQAQIFCKFRLAKEFGSISQKVIHNSLPFLLKGLQYNEAILMGGVRNAFGRQWESLNENERNFIEDNILANAITDENSMSLEKIKLILRDQYQLQEKSLKKLYHHSDRRQMSIPKHGDTLKAIQSIKNPIVQAALFELNALLPQLKNKCKEYGGIDDVKIEMARELKKSKKQRQQERIRNWENERENDACKIELDLLGLPHTLDNIQRIWLWRECKHVCPYSGREIGLRQLFDDGSWQIEHILPYSVCLDDSLANKTLCEAGFNQIKGNKTPYEAFHDSPDWQNMIMRAYKSLPYRKAQRFASKTHEELDTFISRQLNDTRYIAREARTIVERFIPKVSITQGGVTSLLRQQWGLNGILNHRYELPEFVPNGEYYVAVNADDEIASDSIQRWVADSKLRNKIHDDLKRKGRVLHGYVQDGHFFPSKSRDDHRHHAVDAITVACTKTSHLQTISRLKGKDEAGHRIITRMRLDEPWPNFWRQAKDSVENILVSHKNRRRTLTERKQQLFDKRSGKPLIKQGNRIKSGGLAARGELHKATYYGKYVHIDEQEYLHERVDLDQCRTKKHIDQIVDKNVRDAVLKRLIEIGVNVEDPKFKVPENTSENPVYFRKDQNGKKIPLVFMKNKNGAPIPIKKVRIFFPSSTKIQLHGINRFVEPGNNHHIVIYEDEQGKWQEEIVTFWQAIERKKQKQPVYQLPVGGKRVITNLQINHMFILGMADEAIDWNSPDMRILSSKLYRVQKLSSSDYTFRQHLASSQEYDTQQIRVRSMNALLNLNPIKVRIDRTGKIIRL